MVDDQPAWLIERLIMAAGAFDTAKTAVNERAAEEAQRQAGG